jgi:LysR family transcriptional regulator, carnitine catabolism transcriptional activator
VTMSVKTLEAEIGLPLVDRTTRTVSPSVHGERFATVAERLLEDLESALGDLRADAERRSGLVVAAANGSFMRHVMPPVLGILAMRYPGISVRLLEEHMDGAKRRVFAGEVDFAVLTLSGPDPTLDTVPLLRDRFGLVCLASHKLASRGPTLDWEVLRGQPVIGLNAQAGIRLLLDRHPESAPFLERPHYEVSSVDSLRSLIEQDIGVAVVPALTAQSMALHSRFVFRPLVPTVYRTVYLAKRPGRSLTPAASEVADTILKCLRDLASPEITVLADALNAGSPTSARPEPGTRGRYPDARHRLRRC